MEISLTMTRRNLATPPKRVSPVKKRAIILSTDVTTSTDLLLILLEKQATAVTDEEFCTCVRHYEFAASFN